MPKPIIYIVGADKGGVGKTMVSRALLDYFKSKGLPHRAFDTETPQGVLRRFFPDRTEIVDFTDSDGQMRVLDTIGDAFTVIDIRAGLLSPTLTMLREIGFIDPEKCRIVVLHVLGNSRASIDELKSITASIATARYVGIGNHITATKFNFPADALDIPMLDVRACEDVDAIGASFSDYIESKASAVLRGKARHWLSQVFAQFDGARLIER